MRTLGYLLRAILLGALLQTLLFAADEAKKNYDIPAGDAASALKEFSRISGRETLFAAEAVRGVKTPAIRGELTAQEAIDALLTDTGLIATADVRTGAYAVRKETAAETKNDSSRLAEAKAAGPVKIQDGVLQLEKFEVTERRIDGMINKSLLPTHEGSPIYHEVIHREEIERLGVTSFEELFRYIPQTSSAANGLQSPPGNINVSGGTVANISRVGLRGFPQSQTVILINGRLQPRAGTFNTSGTDLSRIPIAAIERVEILPLSGSALYGAGALGGAINVILRKDYAGRELSTYVGTSTDGGATEFRVTYLEGRTTKAFGRRTATTLTVDYNHREPLYHGDRNYINRVWEKYGPDSPLRSASGVPAFEIFTLRAFSGAPATLLVGNSPSAAINDLGIPGAPGARYAAVPLGTTVAGSQLLTPASFTATANQMNRGNRFQRTTIYQPVDNLNVNLQLEHDLVPDRVTLYSEMSYIQFRSQYSFPQFLSVSLSASDPLNPFRTNVTPGFVGRPVTVFFDPIDIRDPSVTEKRETARMVLGARGKVGERWEWSLDGTFDYNHTFTGSNNTVNMLPTLLSANAWGGFTDSVTGQPYVPAPLATRRAVYPLLADHNAFPVPVSDNDTYWQDRRNSGSVTRNWLGLARLTGSPFALPAGDWNVSLVGELTKYHRQSGQSFYTPDALMMLISGFPFRDSSSFNPADRTSQAGVFETTIPVIGRQWRPIPIEAFDINFSTRYQVDRSDFISPSSGAFKEDRKTSDTTVVGAKLQLTRDVAVRGSMTEGFYPPDWNDFGDPVRESLNSSTAADPLRGNTIQPAQSYTIRNGGNPDLRPESARSYSVGLILTPRFLPTLSLSVDYWSIEKIDAIQLISAANMIARPADFPDRIVRAPLTAADQALGYTGGLITLVDQTRINVGLTKTNGADAQIRYSHDFGAAGRLDVSTNSSWTNEFTTQQFPGRPFINTAGAGGPLRWRGRGSATWTKNHWSATLTARYSGHYSTSTTAPTTAFPNAFPWDGGRIPAFMRYDVQFGYEVPAQGGASGWRRWVAGTRWVVGCQNIFNDEPAMVTNGNSYYDLQDDPRQRFVYLQIKKSL